MISFTRIALTTVAMSLLCACAVENDDLLQEEQEEAVSLDEGIIGGVPATNYPEAALIRMSGGGACSGAVIAPKVVLTAGHCVHGFSSFTVRAPFANNQSSTSTSGRTFDWTNDSQFVDPNQHDIGVIFLNTAINLASYPTIATTGLPSGSRVRNIGRIRSGAFSNSQLFIGPQVTIFPGSQVGFPFDYASNEIIESGDSGGPVVNPGTHHIVAVNSGGGGGRQVLARVDLLAGWIQEQIDSQNGNPPPADPCNGITFAGQCSGNTVMWCENNQVNQINCSPSGRTCGFDSGNSFFNCL